MNPSSISCRRSLDLLLRAELVRVAALLLAAVHGLRRQARVALPADHLVAVVLAREHDERRLHDSAAETKHQVKGRLLLDVVVGERPAVLELLAGEDQALLVRGNSFL